MATLTIALGRIECYFAENAAIAVSNIRHGRPWDQGRVPPTHVRDYPGQPDYMIVEMPDADGR